MGSYGARSVNILSQAFLALIMIFSDGALASYKSAALQWQQIVEQAQISNLTITLQPTEDTGIFVVIYCQIAVPDSCTQAGFFGLRPDTDDEDGNPKSPPPPPEGTPMCKGSDIDVFAQSVGERIAIAGTPFELTYNSSRGRRAFEYRTEMGACTEPRAGSGNPDCSIEAFIGNRLVV